MLFRNWTRKPVQSRVGRVNEVGAGDTGLKFRMPVAKIEHRVGCSDVLRNAGAPEVCRDVVAAQCGGSITFDVDITLAKSLDVALPTCLAVYIGGALAARNIRGSL